MSNHIKQIKLPNNETIYDVAVDITATASDDDIVVLTGTNGTNAVAYDAKHAKKGPSTTESTTAGATADVTVTAGDEKKTIKVPKVTVDTYGHTTGLTEQTLSITIPATPTSLKNPEVLTVGAKTYDGSAAVTIEASDLGLSAAMKFIGTTTTEIADGSTDNPITINNVSTTATNGNVVIYGAKEFIWNGSAWEEFGNEGNYKVKQKANSQTATATQTIKSVSQNENGDVTVETQDIIFPVTSVNGKTGPVTIDVPTVNDATLTIQKNGTNIATFTANSASNTTANITVPTKTSELTNDSGFKTTDNNTTYTFATGDSNGQIKVTASDGTKKNVSVKGLGSAAYTASTDYAPSGHVGDSTHVSATEKATWNAKSDFSGSYNDLTNKPTIPKVPSSLPANGGNADTVDNKHASDFATAAQGTKADNALPKTGGTMTGKLQVNAPIFGYNYTNNSNAPAFIFDKPGSYYTGIGANGEQDTILFAPVFNDGWADNHTQKWKFQGDVIVTGNLNGTATNAVNDGNGNSIANTYATKTELNNAIATAVTTALNASY